jgi:hypothetical protein
MYSQLVTFAAFASLAISSLAVPLRVETREPHPIIPCFPTISEQYPEGYTSAIAPTVDHEYAWTIFEDDSLRILNVSLVSLLQFRFSTLWKSEADDECSATLQRNAHDIYDYEKVKYNNNYVFSQVRNETNEFRFTLVCRHRSRRASLGGH